MAFFCCGQVPLAFAAIGDSQPFSDLVPATLHVYYGHDMGTVAELELKDRKIVCRSNHGEQWVHIQPTLDQWSKFIAELNAAKVYKWQDHYLNRMPVARDGNFRWSFEIQIGDRHFASDGDTDFPLDGDVVAQKQPSDHISFELMLKAVSELIGRDFP